MSDFNQPCIPSTQAEIGGYTWTIFADTTAETIERIIKVSKALQRQGFSAPKRPAFGGGRPQSKPLTQPLVRDDGTPCCPHHTQRDGRPTPIRYIQPKNDLPGFWGCPSQPQGVAGEQISNRGYCALRFDWAAPAEVTK